MQGTKSMSVRLISTVVNGECFAVLQYKGDPNYGDIKPDCYEVRKTTKPLFPGDTGRTEVITLSEDRATAMATYREVVATARDC